MLIRLLVICCWAVFLYSCTSKYHAYKSKYAFSSPDGNPQYEKLDYWAAHPWKWDPSDSIPQPLANESRDSTVDVFFLHPTTFTKKKFRKISNVTIDDAYHNAKTDYSTILYQASVFNQQCRVFAPRYRQAHIRNFFRKDKELAAAAFEKAYQDIKASFDHYLRTWNNGRPIIIAGHSQGSFLAERLLKEYFEKTSLENKLVAAFIIGWPVPKDYFTSLRMCEDSLQTGCICSWRTLKKNFVPPYLKTEKGNAYVTNPLTWKTTAEHAPRELNKGSVLTNFNKIYPATTDAQISNGFLYVTKPRFPGSFLYLTRNYHIGDINLYYINLRENISRRIAMFWKK